MASRMYLSPTGVRTTRPPLTLDDGRKTTVGEHADDEGRLCERGSTQPVEGDDAQELVTIHDLAVLVDRHASVRIPVEGEAASDPSSADEPASARGPSRRSPRLMLLPSGLVEVDPKLGAGRGDDLGMPARPRSRWRSRARRGNRAGRGPRGPDGAHGSGRGRHGHRRPDASPPLVGLGSSSARQSSASRLVLDPVIELEPRSSSTLSPLSSAGL